VLAAADTAKVDDLWELFRALRTQRIFFLCLRVESADGLDVLATRSIVLAGETIPVPVPEPPATGTLSPYCVIVSDLTLVLKSRVRHVSCGTGPHHGCQRGARTVCALGNFQVGLQRTLGGWHGWVDTG
jgi:hypothetical protein